ncbi:MAG: hypothetical protein LBJ67_03960 [Planctomycetaceae bacterium]|jgi:hypothetical protein|nr:hypothetical protein [Planctomycetaceae bacterium]
MTIKKHLLLLSVLIFLPFTACSDKVKISGRVTFPDGKPVSIGEVNFATREKSYLGRLNQEGYYAPGELKDGDGIPAGIYQVWLSKTSELKYKLNKNGEYTDEYIIIEKVAPKYHSNNSGLIFEVKRGGTKTFDFTVERAKPSSQK